MTAKSDRRLAFAILAAVFVFWFLWPWPSRPNRPATKWVPAKSTACAMPVRDEPTPWLVTWTGATA